ncbi:MAG: hypothetical protein QM569_02395 [Acidovorax sp.]|uniref:hypothetical protein n=1 Tax=Acidovorax sp. TaxID=1872122 RepID=UPI0039E6C145
MHKKFVVMAGWSALLALVLICYWAGLHGGFVFDDDVNILQNSSLRITNGTLDEFWAAAVSGHAGPLGRPVALLTFALNYYWAGTFDAFQFKLVNLAIHLVNAILVGCFAQWVCEALTTKEKAAITPGLPWAGLMVAALWALHPLNLTAVLYAVQRMTSLCTLFGMAGVVIYVWYRRSTYQSLALKHPLPWGLVSAVAVLACLILSALSKESGVLFAPLIFWLEYCVFGFRYKNNALRLGRMHMRTAVTCVVMLTAVYVAVFKLPSMVGHEAYANREFTLMERGLTEARILIIYLRMLLLPQVSQMSLYHDDIVLSHSLLSPLSTIFALIALLLITAAAWLLRKKVPVLLFGWGWFLISHALESTIFPLELMYEHRNYFAIIGPLLAVPMLVFRLDAKQYGKLAAFCLVAYVALLGFITHVRSLQWSNTMDWAALEAENRPGSMRASYELGRLYIVLLHTYGDPKFGQLADDALVRAQNNDKGALLPLAARIQLAYMQGAAPKPELIEQLKTGFRTEKYRNVNTSVLQSLMNCQLQKNCHMADNDMMDILQAAYENPLTPISERAEVSKLMGNYLISGMNDLAGGVALIRQSIDLQDKASSRIMYAQALAMGGKFNAAMSELDEAERLDTRREQALFIERERKNIKEAMQ